MVLGQSYSGEMHVYHAAMRIEWVALQLERLASNVFNWQAVRLSIFLPLGHYQAIQDIIDLQYDSIMYILIMCCWHKLANGCIKYFEVWENRHFFTIQPEEIGIHNVCSGYVDMYLLFVVNKSLWIRAETSINHENMAISEYTPRSNQFNPCGAATVSNYGSAVFEL